MPSTRDTLRAMFCAAIVVAAGFAPKATAHSLNVTRGTATIEGDTLSVQLESSDHADSVLARLSIRDAQGDRLTGRPMSMIRPLASANDSVFRYPLAPDTSHVSFQLVPTSTANTAHVANVVLAVRINGEDRRAIRLASSGNVEVVQITPAPGTAIPTGLTELAGPCESRRREWFVLRSGDRSVRSIVTVEEWGVRIELLIPTPVIETWVPIGRANRDFLEPIERERAIAKLEAFVVDRFAVRVNGSSPLSPKVSVRFLDFAGHEATTDPKTDRLSAWASRLHVSLRFRSAERPGSVDVAWKLFNAIVLTANVLTITPGDCNEFDFSTYDSRWFWHRW